MLQNKNTWDSPLLLSNHIMKINLLYSYTIPHKEAGLKCCDEIDPIAKVIDHFFLFAICWKLSLVELSRTIQK